MGHKVHPIGFRLGINKEWQSKWYADKTYHELLQEDLSVRKAIYKRLADAGVPRIEIDRNANQITVTVHTSRPGVVIGKAGQKVDELRMGLEVLTGKKVRINIQEIRQPELDATLVARTVAEQIEKRVSHKRAMKQAVMRAMQRGAKGAKILCSGRLGGAEMSRREWERVGQVPLQTIRADMDYGFDEAKTAYGRVGVKVWVYKGDILPEVTEEQFRSVPREEGIPT
ncbi:MAG: 30S ribosomal protein S3 [Chloroflexi bacterium]|nr:30S ribosomal protein S3 [Chloroflexota bacterium]